MTTAKDENHNRQRRNVRCVVIGIINLLVLLAVTILLSPSQLIYDERYYIETVPLLQEKGFTRDFLISLDGYAGPLYTVVHYFCAPLTGLAAPQVRLVNSFLAVGLVLVLFLILRQLKTRTPLGSSLSITAIPMMWVVSGMALTEIPAMFCVASSLLLLLYALEYDDGSKRVVCAALGGLAFGLGIMGRQTFLVVLLLLPFLAFRYAHRRAELFIYGVGALILPLIVFSIWGGLIPPLVAGDEQGFAVNHLLLSCAYTGFAVLIINPRWYDFSRRTILFLIVLVIVINLLTQTLIVTPLYSVARRMLTDDFLNLYSIAASGLLASIGVLFLFAAVKNIWNKRDDTLYVFITLAGVFVVGTALKITTIFSSRYPATAIPFLLLSAEYDNPNKDAKPLRLAVGALIGIASLLSYYLAS